MDAGDWDVHSFLGNGYMPDRWLSTPDGLMRTDGVCMRQTENGWMVTFPDDCMVAAHIYEPDVIAAMDIVNALYPNRLGFT